MFGTNPSGIEYDGQVAGEGLTGGVQRGTRGTGVPSGDGISAFNPNWDGDWTVRARHRAGLGNRAGDSVEDAALLRPASDRTWGFNVMRNIRRKNEQVYLAPIPRGFDIYRVSLAAKMTGLTLPARATSS